MCRESSGELPHPIDGAAGQNAVPPSSHLFDGDGVAARREGDVPAEAGEHRSSS